MSMTVRSPVAGLVTSGHVRSPAARCADDRHADRAEDRAADRGSIGPSLAAQTTAQSIVWHRRGALARGRDAGLDGRDERSGCAHVGLPAATGGHGRGQSLPRARSSPPPHTRTVRVPDPRCRLDLLVPRRAARARLRHRALRPVRTRRSPRRSNVPRAVLAPCDRAVAAGGRSRRRWARRTVVRRSRQRAACPSMSAATQVASRTPRERRRPARAGHRVVFVGAGLCRARSPH